MNGRTRAYTKRLSMDMDSISVLAWLTGNYNAHAYHDPKHYPKKPEVSKPPKKMSEKAIKNTLIAFAEIHNEGVTP